MGFGGPVVVIKHYDGEDNTAGHHHHDAVEVGASTISLISIWID